MRKLLLKIVAGVVLIYIGYGTLMIFAESSMMYHPDSTSFYNCDSFEDNEMKEYNETRFYHKDRGGDTAVFYHGNAGRACDRADLLEQIRAEESYIIVEYTGYGESENPDKETLKQDVENMAEYLEQHENNIYVIGNSLGGSMASLHASKQEVEGLLLVNPFYSAETWAWTFSPFYPDSFQSQDFNNSEYLENAEDDTLILYSENDRVIPPEENKRLAEEHDVERKMIEGRGHNDIFLSQKFQTELQNFISR